MIAKISIALSVVLSIIVGVLWYKVSTVHSNQDGNSAETPLAAAFSADSGPRAPIVAYVNGDSLNAKYDFIVEKSKDLDQKMAAAEERVKKEYGPRQAQYEQNMRYAQEHPDMSEAEAIALQKDMERLQIEMDEIQQREVGVLQKKRGSTARRLA